MRLVGVLVIFGIFWLSEVKAGEYTLEKLCQKYASLENGGKHLERQFFLLFGVLEEEFPNTKIEDIAINTFIIWSDNFKAQGFSNSYYDFIRTFTKQVEKLEGPKDFDTVFKAYCIALLAAAYTPE